MVNVVIVESPAKAKTINKYLGADFKVVASYGHIRDLLPKNGSVKPEEDFAMEYEVNDTSQKHVAAIAAVVKDADEIFLASDPDREGEAIAWHVVEVLRQKKLLKANIKISRIVFNEITKKAVQHAIKNPRDIDMNLVNAQQARRALDYLVGFNLSPILWRKLPGSRSAGRVQSVALRLLCDREDEIEKFVSQEYWRIKGEFAAKKNFFGFLTYLADKKLEKFDINNQAQATEIVESAKTKRYKVADIEKKQVSRHPAPPFTTSTLQQEASRKLGFGAKKTMMVAQKLYEGIKLEKESVGLITYMRTDSVSISVDAVEAVRTLIKDQYGDKYLPSSVRYFKNKSKNAQEAHEAIRPTNLSLLPSEIAKFLDNDQQKLYELIWKRAVASQMASALIDTVAVDVKSDGQEFTFRANGSVMVFDGFYKLYVESVDDDEEEESKLLPDLTIGQELPMNSCTPTQHFTEPPARYNEASLVKKLEELGIGRPSTYATIISVLQDREYVYLENRRFFCEERGRIVTAFLMKFFHQYVEYNFTAELEDKLDGVAAHELNWKVLMKEFWDSFKANVDEVGAKSGTEITDAVNSALEFHYFANKEGVIDRACPDCKTGILNIKTSKYGAFIGCSNYPTCAHTKQLVQASEDGAAPENSNAADILIGVDKESGTEIFLRKGPYGHYLQLGKLDKESNPKPKRASLPKDLALEAVNLDVATSLINLPRLVGLHPGTGKEIRANYGKFGAYLAYDGKFFNSKNYTPLSITLEQAIEIMTAEAEKHKELGEFDGEKILLCKGRFGPYLKYKSNNIKIPKNWTVEDMTLEDAIKLVNG